MLPSSTGNNERCSGHGHCGFTLIELMVALVIVVIISGVVMISIGPALRDAKMRASCRIIASAMNYARSYAVTTNQVIQVTFNPDNSVEVDEPVSSSTGGQESASSAGSTASGEQQFRVMTTSAGKRQALPDGIEIVQVLNSDSSTNTNWVQFSNLGQSTGASVELSDAKGQTRYVLVDVITGRCKVVSSVSTRGVQNESPGY